MHYTYVNIFIIGIYIYTSIYNYYKTVYYYTYVLNIIVRVQAIPRLSESILYGIFMHEIIHALGFSHTLFDRLVT